MLFVLVAFCFRRDGEDAHSWYSQSDATVNKVSCTPLRVHLGKRSSRVKDALSLAAAKRKKKAKKKKAEEVWVCIVTERFIKLCWLCYIITRKDSLPVYEICHFVKRLYRSILSKKIIHS